VSPIDPTDELGRRLRTALQVEADAVRYDEAAGLDAVRRGGRAAHRRRRAALAGIAALMAAAIAIPLLLGDGDRTVTTRPDPAPSTTASEPSTTSTSPPAPSTEPRPPTPPSSTTPPDTAPEEGAGKTPATLSQPALWPFRTAAEVDGWRASHRADGSEPWHLDAEQTALEFTTGYLGFAEIDRVLRSDIGATEAYVVVGYALPDEGRLSAAANVHLLRWGTADDAPWEVVGTEDESLTLDTPAYGATVTSPLTVGGKITGVDESLHVRVLQPSSPAALGETCCAPAGGEDTRWSVTVPFSGATDRALTVVVSTGGHVQDVERFAITAVRPR
jgi:hypothetical protein